MEYVVVIYRYGAVIGRHEFANALTARSYFNDIVSFNSRVTSARRLSPTLWSISLER